MSVKAPFYNFAGEKVGEVEIQADFWEEKINEPVLHAFIEKELAGRRQGGAATKTRSEVRGGGRKPWRQKGTGRARAGSIRSPLWRGGGVVFGPQPRSYGYTLPRKLRRLALRSALAAKLKEGNLVVIEDAPLPEAKTKVILRFLTARQLSPSALFVACRDREAWERATKNLPHVDFLPLQRLSVYEILRHENLVLTKEALARLGEVL